jgi:hypothetical protein
MRAKLAEHRVLKSCGVAALVLWAGGLSANAQGTQQIAHVDSYGAWVETGVGPAISTPCDVSEPRGPGVVWSLNVAGSIAQSVVLSDTTNESWVGENLNYERLSYFHTVGNNTPVWEFSLSENPDVVAVASAESVSLCVLSSRSASTGALLRAFDRNSGGRVPTLWDYVFEAQYVNFGMKAVDVAADGHLVLAAAQMSGTAQSLVVVLDGATGAELNRRVINQYVSAVELSDDGMRAALTEGATTEIVETDSLAGLFSFPVSGAGGTARLSRDGQVAAAGGFDYHVYRDNGGTWGQIYHGSESGEWLGNGIALSANGDTMFLVSHNYAGGYLRLTYRLVDLTQGVELHRIVTQGTGTLQDAVQRAEMSGDGRVMAVVSWGTQNMVHPQTQVFDRQLTRIGGITSPGSPFDLDMARSGEYLLVGCKHVHANSFGNGGDIYSYAVPIVVIGDLNCDGLINFDDIDPFVLALSDPPGYGVAYPYCNILNGDANEDGAVNFDDIDAFVAVLSG